MGVPCITLDDCCLENLFQQGSKLDFGTRQSQSDLDYHLVTLHLVQSYCHTPGSALLCLETVVLHAKYLFSMSL